MCALIELWGRVLKHVVALGVTLYVTWLLLSGVYQTLWFVLGVISCAICLGIALRMDVVDRETYAVHLSKFLPR